MKLSRVRSFSPLSLLALFTLLFSTASAAVIGIDLGTEYIKAVLVRNPLDIVLTKDSRRKEAAAISFKPVKAQSSFEKNILPERNYGADAVALSARFPGDTFQNIKSLLGVPFTNEAVSRFSERYPAIQVVEEKERGRVALRSATFVDNEVPFLVEELLAMELQNVATNAHNMAKAPVRDVVFTVPAYWTVDEKDALRRAAELADLNVLALVTDGLAIGLDYAKSRTFPTVNAPGKPGKPEYHVIYDMGAGGTTATVLKMQGRIVKDIGKLNKTIQEVQVVGVGWDASLGGDALNTVILNNMIDQLAESPKIKVLGATRAQIAKDGRTVSKLWKESERMRQVLSANTETAASFEGLFHEDVSFKYKLSRTQFESMIEGIIPRVRSPIDMAMHSSRLEFSDIESIIVHGGAQRAPFVQKELEQALENVEVRNNVNSDESAVFGAALVAASRSSSFRVKEIRTSEVGAHDAWISWTQDGKEKNQKIFTESSASGKSKQLAFRTVQEDLSFEVFQQVLDGSDMRNVPVSTVSTTNMTKAVSQLTEKHSCALADIKTQVEIFLDPAENLPKVVRATVSCEVTDEKKGGIVDGIKGFFGGKKGDQEVLDDDEDAAESTSVKSGSASAAPSADAKESKEPKTRIETVYVGVSTDISKRKQMSAADVTRVRSRLSSFVKSDVNRAQRSESLNQLEAYTYRVRDLIENEAFMAVSTAAQRQAIADMASTAGEWIYGDGLEAAKAEFDKRLKDLKALVTPIEKRREESAGRPGQLEYLEQTLNSTKSLLDTLKASADQAAKDAISLAADAASSVSSAASSAVAGSDDDDGFAELEDETSSSSSLTATTKSIPTPIFTADDFEKAYEKIEKAQSWLKEKLAAQAKLAASDEPAILLADIKSKANELSKITTDMIQKQLKAAQGAEKAEKAKSKSSKSKTRTAKTKKVTMSDGDSTVVGDESSTATAEKSGSTTHDEL